MLKNLADEKPDITNEGLAILEKWHFDMMANSTEPVDPMQIVLREGGPFHTRTGLEGYCEHLKATGRGRHTEKLMKKYNK